LNFRPRPRALTNRQVRANPELDIGAELHTGRGALKPDTERDLLEPAHRVLHPFGQIPTYAEGFLAALFETGAIVLDIGERHAGLLPDHARARAIAWMFAALNTVEPPIPERETARLLEGDKT
jgi:glutathione S-transferase